MGAEATDPRERALQQALARTKQRGIFQTPTIGDGPGGAPTPLAAPQAAEDIWGPPPDDDIWGPPPGPPPSSGAALVPTPLGVHSPPPAPPPERAESFGQGREAFGDAIAATGVNLAQNLANSNPELRAPVSRQVHSQEPLTPEQVQAERPGGSGTGDNVAARILARSAASRQTNPVMAMGGDVAALGLVPTGGGGARAAGWIPRLGRIVEGAGVGGTLNAAVEPDQAQRGQAFGEGAVLGAGTTAVGEGLAAVAPAARDMASRAYGRVAAGGYAGAARAARLMDGGLERFGEVTRDMNLGRLFGGGVRNAGRVRDAAGAEVGAISAAMPPANLQSVVRHLQTRAGELSNLGASGERLGAVAEQGASILSPNRQEALASRLATEDGPAPLSQILRHIGRRGEPLPFEELRGTRQLLGEQLERPTIEGRTGAAAERSAGYGAVAQELQNTADQAGRGDAWRRANERYQASVIAHEGQQHRQIHGDTATAASIRGFTPMGIVQTQLNRGTHRIVLTVADMLHAVTRTNPRALGVYGPAFMRMQQQHGETGVAAEHYRRSVTDPAYSAATDESDE